MRKLVQGTVEQEIQAIRRECPVLIAVLVQILPQIVHLATQKCSDNVSPLVLIRPVSVYVCVCVVMSVLLVSVSVYMFSCAYPNAHVYVSVWCLSVSVSVCGFVGVGVFVPRLTPFRSIPTVPLIMWYRPVFCSASWGRPKQHQFRESAEEVEDPPPLLLRVQKA